jgi:hypothetical protein
MGGGVATTSVYGDHACLEQMTFEADTIVEIYAQSHPRALIVSGWSLTISDSSADVCPVSLCYADGTKLFGTIIPLQKTTAGDYAKPWTITGLHLTIPAGVGLGIIGGASGATLNGVVFVSEVLT